VKKLFLAALILPLLAQADLGGSMVAFLATVSGLRPGGIVTTGIILHLDAARFNGTDFPGTGCGLTTWQDLSAGNHDGTLTNCTSGLEGDGTAASPYRLDFSGNDYVEIDSSVNGDNLDDADDITLCALHYPTQNGDDGGYHVIVANRHPAGSSVYQFLLQSSNTGAVNCGTGVAGALGMYATGSPSYDLCNAGSSVTKNTWQFSCVKYEGSTLSWFHNGASAGSDTSGLSSRTAGGTWNVGIGAFTGGGEDYEGDIAWLGIYSRALTSGEILQNCNELKRRVSGMTCG
jgi:hypothetical protein